ncbi:beta-microseminoprotein J1-like [Trichosurus vulpecula]|uniref:beta-microseminoprotein J1-like n=1 Tax=Trichosurus vulpecula TaxID=9337 RepID=UPI00186ABE26|nr:beta-microseminoprotein J1-like [Trichosurus vulpecula]
MGRGLKIIEDFQPSKEKMNMVVIFKYLNSCCMERGLDLDPEAEPEAMDTKCGKMDSGLKQERCNQRESSSENTMLGVLFALAIFVIFCDAWCTVTPLEISPGGGAEGCMDSNSVMHNFDTQWESNCMSCSCDARVGLSCCSKVMRPTGYDEVKCKEIFNKETCTIAVVEKVDPTVSCEVTGSIG